MFHQKKRRFKTWFRGYAYTRIKEKKPRLKLYFKNEIEQKNTFLESLWTVDARNVKISCI